MDNHPLPPEINVITLNCWGLKHISKLRTERIAEIARRIAAADPAPGIVALQELFCQEDYECIRRETRAVLPHGKFYYSGAFGAGLVILSRWPIEESSMLAYPLNGRPTAFWRGDWYVGKGVACAKIRFGPGRRDVVEVFNTHLHARYSDDKGHTYDCHIASQAWEIAKLLRAATEKGHLALALGDFNTLPLSLPHRIITTRGSVRDAWRLLHPDSSLGPANNPAERERHRPVPTAEFNLRENGATSDTVYITWRWPRAEQKLLGTDRARVVPPDAVDERGQRLDYVFAGPGDIALQGGAGWVVKTARVGMTEPHPTLGCSVSDHFSVEATLAFHTPSPVPPSSRSSASGITGVENPPAAALTSGAYLQTQASPAFCPSDPADPLTAQLRSAALSPDDASTPASTCDEILALITSYTRRETAQRTRRFAHFFASLVVWLACLVAVWFAPRNFVAFILLLVGSLSLVAGTVDGLMALLFFGAELRRLKEFEWEVLNAKAGGDLAFDALARRGKSD